MIYAVDALFYLIAALRDVDCLWWITVIPGCDGQRDIDSPLLASDSKGGCDFQPPTPRSGSLLAVPR